MPRSGRAGSGDTAGRQRLSRHHPRPDRGDDFYLAGGMRVEAYPQGVFVTRNLTSEPETGLGNWTEAQIAMAIRDGQTPTRTLNILGMPWMFLHSLTEDDALAIARYLKT